MVEQVLRSHMLYRRQVTNNLVLLTSAFVFFDVQLSLKLFQLLVLVLNLVQCAAGGGVGGDVEGKQYLRQGSISW